MSMHQTVSQPLATIIIRPLHPNDAAPAYQAINESRASVGAWMPDLAAVPSVEAVEEWIGEARLAYTSGQMFHFAIVDATSNIFLGGCGLTQISVTHRFANLYYWVRSSQVKKGIASTATRLLAAWGFENAQLHRIEIVVAVENTASLRVAEKVGALREGILRNRLWLHDRPYDAVMFSLTQDDVR
jgi:RimJ/RimL family protein N-acetyltransferase